MQRNYTLLAALTVFIVLCTSYGAFMTFRVWSLPVAIDLGDGRIGTLEPFPGMAMPDGLLAGDRIDLPTQSEATRIAIEIGTLSTTLGQSLAVDGTYDFIVTRKTGTVTVPVHAVDVSRVPSFTPSVFIVFSISLVTAVLALLILWRGRDRAAAGMAIWTVGLSTSGSLLLPLDGLPGLAILIVSGVFILMARVGFYLMADAIARPILSSRARAGWLVLFLVLLGAGAATTAVGGPLLYAFTGWGLAITPRIGILLSASYLVPVLMLFACYQRASQEQRLRLRWMLWSSVLYTAGIFTSNTPVISPLFSLTFTDATQLLGIAGMLYAVLRHRVMDVSVVIDKTLVYGATTSLVVGVIAAMNSLALRATLGEGTSLLLQVVVPLALGIVLGKLRGYMDMAVERVFFRAKYLADKALRNFGKQCAYITDMARLLDASVTELRKHSRSPAVALYEAGTGCYACLRSAGETGFARVIDLDDPALVAVRAEMRPVELSELDSAFGKDGCVFPIEVLGHLRGVMVCANRPGEHFSNDEKALLGSVVRDVGAAWRILKSRENEEFVLAVAQGSIKATAVRKRAKALTHGWGATPVRA